MTANQVHWRVPRKVPIGKLAVAAIVALLAAIAATDWWQVGVAMAVAAGLVAWAGRDLLAPVRLAAGPDGLMVVTGYANQHRLTWSQIQRVRVDVRRRSRMLEVDVGDHLYLYSRYDVDADLDDIAGRLEQWRLANR